MFQPQDNTWYVVATCEKCDSRIFLFRDLTEGAGSLNALYVVTCPSCFHQGRYECRHYRYSIEESTTN
jgi:hypothetical protein